MAFPPFPRHLTPDERRAVRLQAATDFVASVLKDQVARVPKSMLDEMTNQAIVAINISWLTERVEALEVAAKGGDT